MFVHGLLLARAALRRLAPYASFDCLHEENNFQQEGTRKPNDENAKPQPQTEASLNSMSGGQRGHC